MDLNIHNVTKITADTPTKGSSSGSYFRSIYVHTEKGETIEISCFANKFNQLLIKSEE